MFDTSNGLAVTAKMVYLDCDGVIANINEYLLEHLKPEELKDNKKVLNVFYEDYENVFKISKRIEKGFSILNSLSDYRILSAMPNFSDFLDANITNWKDAHERFEVLYQNKIEWLIKNGIKPQNIIIVPNRKCKSYFAEPGNILIDDYPQNIFDWEKAGGTAFLFHEKQEFQIKGV